MARFIITKKMTVQEAFEAIKGIEIWFSKNPSRKVCNTETFKVRRGFTGTDVLGHTDTNHIDW